MRAGLENLPVGVALVQLADAIGNEMLPDRVIRAHLDHLGVPERLRAALPVIKVLSSTGLLVGLRAPRLGAMTSLSLVGYYVAGAGFHVRAHDHPILAAPAVLLGVAAGVALLGVYAPAMADT